MCPRSRLEYTEVTCSPKEMIGRFSSFSSLPVLKSRYSVIRMSSNYLINDPDYSWLRQLGLSERNPGVFDGLNWCGRGPVSEHLLLLFFNFLSSDCGFSFAG